MQIEQRIDLKAALSTLTDRQRAVLYASKVLGVSQQEIAEAMGIQQPAVCKYLQRILQTLRMIVV